MAASRRSAALDHPAREPAGLGQYGIWGEGDPDRVVLAVEPLIGKSQATAAALGRWRFSYYLGLPPIRRKMPRSCRHIRFTNHPWPSDETIRRWAYSGVTVVRLHNDYHDSGDFWRDGAWPPYDAAGMAEMRRVIATCHEYGLRIVPYLSLYELHPASNAFAANCVDWRRTVDDRHGLIETHRPTRFYGFGMYLSSGWKEFLKQCVARVVQELGFDGVYYDYALYWYCNSRHHSDGDHLIVEDLIDLLEYTRELVGPDGLVLLHASSGCPSAIVESYADGHIMFEDCATWEEVPPLRDFPPSALHLSFMNVAPRIPCHTYRARDRAAAAWDLSAKCALVGAFPWHEPEEAAAGVLALFESFMAFDLSQYEFRDCRRGVVSTDSDAVRGAVYFNDERLLVVLVNVADRPAATYRWQVDLDALGWNGDGEVHVVDSRGESVQRVRTADLSAGGVADSLPPFRLHVFALTPHRDSGRRVLYNTRPWTERDEGALVVETRGPRGQAGLLRACTGARPTSVAVDGRPVPPAFLEWDADAGITTVRYTFRAAAGPLQIEMR